jgi:hypothetical protein
MADCFDRIDISYPTESQTCLICTPVLEKISKRKQINDSYQAEDFSTPINKKIKYNNNETTTDDPFFCPFTPIRDNITATPFSLRTDFCELSLIDNYYPSPEAVVSKEKDNTIAALRQELFRLKIEHASEKQKMVQEISVLQAKRQCDETEIQKCKQENLLLTCWKKHYIQFARNGGINIA